MLIQQFNGGVQMPAGGAVRQDSLVFPQELTKVTSTSRTIYRPLFWRDILAVESVPAWVQAIEDRKIRTFVEDPINLTNKGPSEELPLPAFSVSNQFLKLFSFGLAYGYTDEDLELASHTGIALSDENIRGCNLAFETFLEKVASVGHTPTGMKGLGTLADVSTATAANKTAGSDTPWNDATALEIVKDLHTLVDSVYINSKQTATANRIALPIAQWNLANQTLTTALERTAMEVFRAQRPGIDIKVWDKLSTMGAGDTPCAMAWDTRDEYGPKMIVAREATYGAPMRGINGWLVPGKIKIGGVVCRNPLNVSKMSGL
jgi:hypothetical protein